MSGSSNEVERARVAVIERLGLLDEPVAERFEGIIRLAQRLFDVPVVAVNVLDADHQHTLDAVGMSRGSIPLEHSFCSRTVAADATFVVADAAGDERFAGNPLVAEGLRFYAGHPLTVGGQRIGSLCLADGRPRELTAAEDLLLQDLCRWVEDQLTVSDARAQAAEVQRRLLPGRPADVPGYDVAGGSAAARQVSGDYFDWQQLDDCFQVVVADVMGKGITAAIVASAVRAVFRGASRYLDLSRSVARIAETLIVDLADSRAFATLFAARLTPETGDLAWVDAGHGLAIIFSADADRVRVLDSRALPLGVVDDEWSVEQDRLEPGETLLVVSDGILDYFPDPWTAVEAARELAATGPPAQEMVDQVLAHPGEGALTDDVTVVVVRRDRA